MSGGRINATELTAAIINQKQSLVEGLVYAQEMIEGSMTILLLTPEGIYASRDRYGRTPVVVGKKDDACCVSFESFAYINLGYHDCYELGPGEVVLVNAGGVQSLSAPRREMKMCSFLWVYYGYPTSSYEGINVEQMRYNCGRILADRDTASRRQTAGKLRFIRTLWPEFPIPALPTLSAMPMNPVFPLPVPLLNTRQPGPVPLCLRTRASVI